MLLETKISLHLAQNKVLHLDGSAETVFGFYLLCSQSLHQRVTFVKLHTC